jgi:hypothetical protein
MHVIAMVLFLQFGGGDQQGNPGAIDLPDVVDRERAREERATEPPARPVPPPERKPEPTPETDPESARQPVTP